MHKIGPKLKNAVRTNLPSKSDKKMPEQPNLILQSASNTSEGRTCKVLLFYDFWFQFYNKFCSPYPIIGFLCIFNHQSGNLSLK